MTDSLRKLAEQLWEITFHCSRATAISKMVPVLASHLQPQAATDEQIDEMLADLDSYARERDSYDYGLPLSTDDLPKLREIVRNALKAEPQAPSERHAFDCQCECHYCFCGAESASKPEGEI